MPAPRTVEDLGELTLLGSGGQGRVYAAPDRLVDGRWPAAYKEYAPAARAALDPDVLRAMVRLLDDLPAIVARRLHETAAWPYAVVERDGEVAGFVMRQAPEAFHTEIRLPRRRVRRLAQVQLLLNDDRYLSERDLAIDDRFRLELLHDAARAIEHFHHLGIVVGDLSPTNLLFSRVRRPRCFFLDCDGMRLRGATALRQAETPDWQAPADGDDDLPTPATDSYKFALLCIRLFAGSQIARNPAAVHRAGLALGVLVSRGLSADPDRRPDMPDWSRVLAATLRLHRHAPRVPARVPAAAGRDRVRSAPRPLVVVAAGTAGVVLAAGALTLGGRGAGVPDLGGAFSGDRARAAEQARGVSDLLADAGRTRDRADATVSGVAACTDVHAAVAELRRVAGQRRSQLERTSALHTDRLTGGDELRTHLITVLEHARRAAQAYGRWAADVERDGCRSPAMRNRQRRQGDAEMRAAAPARQRVVQLWTPLADHHGRPRVSVQDL